MAEKITAVYAHNDDMALGAIQAIEEYGLMPGEDIKIVSVDAARGAFEAMIAGKLNRRWSAILCWVPSSLSWR